MTPPSRSDSAAPLTGTSREAASELIGMLACSGWDDPTIAARLGLTAAQVADVRREYDIPPGVDAAAAYSPTEFCVACRDGEHTPAEHRADREELPPDLCSPKIDAARATAVVDDCWRAAARIVRQSWPGPSSWSPDRHAANAAWRAQVCTAAGLDVKPLYDEWQARYLVYRGVGGRARFRSIGRPLPPSEQR